MNTDLGMISTRFTSGDSAYTVGGVAKTVRVSPMPVHRLIHAGTLAYLKGGSSFRVTQEARNLFVAPAGFIPDDVTDNRPLR